MSDVTLPTLGLLSITDGRLMADIDHVYEALSFMVGRPVFTHELPKYGQRAKPIIEEHFTDAEMRSDGSGDWQDARDAALLKYGDRAFVPASWKDCLADGTWTVQNLDGALQSSAAGVPTTPDAKGGE